MSSTPNAILRGLSDQDKAKLLRAVKIWKRRPARMRRLRPLVISPKAENRYALALRAEALRISRTVEAAFKPWLARLRAEEEGAKQDAIEKAPALKDAKSIIGRLRKQLRVDEKPAGRMVDEVTGLHLDALNKLVSPVTAGIPIWRGTSLADKAVLGTAFKENVRLIKSIPGHLLTEVEEMISEHLADNARVETIAKGLQNRYEISQRRAETIARTETSKLSAQLTEQRATNAGISEYTWRTSLDERVRDSHKAMEGRVCQFDDPPTPPGEAEPVNPGESYNCRCTAEPKVDDLLDSLLAAEEE